MDSLVPAMQPAEASFKHFLRFDSLHERGRGIAVPCNSDGKVDIDVLSQRLRTAYFGARALVGREYAFPTVQHEAAKAWQCGWLVMPNVRAKLPAEAGFVSPG